MNFNAVKVSVKKKLLLPRSGHKIVSDDKYLYVIGGFVERTNANNAIIREVRGEIWRLHLVYKSWEKCKFDKEIFNLAASHSAIKHGDCIFITGGTGHPFGVNILNCVIVVDVKKMTQTKYQFNPKGNASKNLPIATYGHSTTRVDINNRPYLFVMGGTTGTTYHQEVYKIDLVSLESCLVTDGETRNAPRARYKHEAFLYDDKIYMLGGSTVTDFCFSLDEIHVFDIHTNSWATHETAAKIDKDIRCPSMCQNGQYIYLTGGFTSNNVISPSIHQLDMATLSWTTIGHWEEPCYFHDSVFVPQFGSVLIFGGVHKIAMEPERTNELYQFQPYTGRIATSLADLAWKSVLDLVIGDRYSAGDCTENDAPCIFQDLIRMGLPSSIITRINVRDTRAMYAA